MSFVCNRLLPIVVAFGNVFLCAGQAVAACQPGPFALSLPAQRLDERLQELAHRTGCAVDVDPGLMQGKRSVALSGSLTADQAFIRSVRGSGLEVRPVQGHWQVDRAQQHYFFGRTAVLREAIAQTRKQGDVTQGQSRRLVAELAKVETGVLRHVREQGFLSAAERASYERTLTAVDQALRR